MSSTNSQESLRQRKRCSKPVSPRLSLNSAPLLVVPCEQILENLPSFDHVKIGRVLDIPVFATTQVRGRLGETCSELQLDTPNGIITRAHADKSHFSMWCVYLEPARSLRCVVMPGSLTVSSIPEIREALRLLPESKKEIVIVGIEAHICVLLTALDMLNEGHAVYVLADGVSSCNKEEVPIALDRLKHAGAIITTSESFLYECMGDAAVSEYDTLYRPRSKAQESFCLPVVHHAELI